MISIPSKDSPIVIPLKGKLSKEQKELLEIMKTSYWYCKTCNQLFTFDEVTTHCKIHNIFSIVEFNPSKRIVNEESKT